MDSLERNIALALMLGRLEAALAVIQGLEHKVYGITDVDLQELEPKLQSATAALSDTIHAVIRMLPEGEKIVRRGNLLSN
jgi:hypothetical protein